MQLDVGAWLESTPAASERKPGADKPRPYLTEWYTACVHVGRADCMSWLSGFRSIRATSGVDVAS